MPEGEIADDVPHAFASPEYDDTIVDGHPVLVEPRDRRIVEVIA